MEQVVEVARRLRLVHDFRGYIHLKTIPEASTDLLAAAGLYADRLSINIELARQSSLATLAPQKDSGGIRRSMAAIRLRQEEACDTSRTGKTPPRFATAGQSTQMIVGADAATDDELLTCSDALYSSYQLKRVYYSAFSPIPDASSALPLQPVDLLREHRLYQADWLMRFYDFNVQEIVSGGQSGMLDTELDPKLAWALKHREQFPVDINRAPRSRLLRIPGLGTRGVERVIQCRASGFLRIADLRKISRSVKRMQPFIIARDWSPATLLDTDSLRSQFIQQHAQLDLFDG